MPFILFLGLLSGGSEPPPSVVMKCPAYVDVRQELSGPVTGWTDEYVHRGSGPRRANSGIGVSRRISNRMAAMKPETILGANASLESSHWQLLDGAEYWVYCTYRDSTIQISKALPNGLSSCLVQYRNNLPGALNCK